MNNEIFTYIWKTLVNIDKCREFKLKIQVGTGQPISLNIFALNFYAYKQLIYGV